MRIREGEDDEVWEREREKETDSEDDSRDDAKTGNKNHEYVAVSRLTITPPLFTSRLHSFMYVTLLTMNASMKAKSYDPSSAAPVRAASDFSAGPMTTST